MGPCEARSPLPANPLIKAIPSVSDNRSCNASSLIVMEFHKKSCILDNFPHLFPSPIPSRTQLLLMLLFRCLLARHHFLRSRTNASLISSLCTSFSAARWSFVHSHVHLAITGACFTYSRAHVKGVILSEKACFCLLCAFSTAPS